MNTLIAMPSCGARRELLRVHLDRAVAADADDRLVRAADLRAHRGGQSEAHRAETAGVDPPARRREVVVLRRPHLVLADVGDDDRVAAGGLVQRLDHVLGLDLGIVGVLVAQRMALLPDPDPRPPLFQPGRVGIQRPVLRRQPRQDVGRVTDDRDVGRDVLGDLGRVDVDVDELGARRELRQLAGDPVVESSPDRDDQVRLVHRVVRRPGAVHAEHSQPLRMWRRERAEPHHRARDGQLVDGRQLDQLRRRVGPDDPAAGVDHGPTSVRERLRRQPDLLLVAGRRRLVAGQVHILDRLVVDVRPAQVRRDVDDHRSGTARPRDVERLVHRAWDLVRVLDHEAVLDDRHRDPDRVGLLEPVGPEQMRLHLTGDEHDRDRVHHRVADRRHQVGRAGAAGPQRHADLAGRLGVTLGRVTAAGLVAHQDVADPGVVERVVGREVGTPGEPEYDVDTLSFQTFHQRIDSPHRDLLPGARTDRRTDARRVT